jgi:hypothetical protein
MVQHADIDHTGIPGVGGSGDAGQTVFAYVDGFHPTAAGTSALVASAAYLMPITLPAPMMVTNLRVLVSSAGSGTHPWGLFDGSASSTAATKLAGGSGALNSTGAVDIAATGTPVSVPAGSYFLIIHAPAANAATVRTLSPTVNEKFSQSQTSYAWDDTPSITSGWSGVGGTIRLMYLVGRVDATNAL